MIPALKLHIFLFRPDHMWWWLPRFMSRRRARIWQQETLRIPSSNTMGYARWACVLVEFGFGQPAHDYSPEFRQQFIDKEMRRYDRRLAVRAFFGLKEEP